LVARRRGEARLGGSRRGDHLDDRHGDVLILLFALPSGAVSVKVSPVRAVPDVVVLPLQDWLLLERAVLITPSYPLFLGVPVAGRYLQKICGGERAVTCRLG
jgi:hypothetical protein